MTFLRKHAQDHVDVVEYEIAGIILRGVSNILHASIDMEHVQVKFQNPSFFCRKKHPRYLNSLRMEICMEICSQMQINVCQECAYK